MKRWINDSSDLSLARPLLIENTHEREKKENEIADEV